MSLVLWASRDMPSGKMTKPWGPVNIKFKPPDTILLVQFHDKPCLRELDYCFVTGVPNQISGLGLACTCKRNSSSADRDIFVREFTQRD